MDQYNLNNLGGQFAPNNFEISPVVFDKKIFKVFHLVTMATKVLHGMKIFNNFERGSPKDHSCEDW